MQFGRVNPSTLDDINFTLPPDPPSNQLVLSGTPVAKPQIYMGCARWGRKEWVGRLFPKGTKESNYLDEYVHHFNTIELNATHYKIYDAAAIRKWNERVKRPDFKFCPKVPQSISHYSNLVNAQDQTTAFLEGVLAFEEHLGPIFLQLGENYSPARRDNLYRYLQSLPTDMEFFLEVRHPEWYSDPVIFKELADTLRARGIGAVITDTAGRRDCAHMLLTLPRTMVRFVGNSLHPTDYVRVDEWVERLKYWLENGLEEVYWFMHMHDDLASPEMIVYMMNKIKAVCGISLEKPQFLPQQSSLF